MVILRKLCSRTSKFERSEFLKSFHDFSTKNHLEPSWEPILRVPEQKFWKSAPLKFLFRKYSKKWTENHFFCRNIKILLHCIIIFIFGTVVAFCNANPWNRNFCKFLFRENHHFLHRNCFHTSLKKILRETWGTYPHVKFDGGFENRI